jgi:hypothetical protein
LKKSLADLTMPLQNRVTPEGDIIATPHRGLMLGNRGGCFHLPDKSLRPRRWATRQWITCLLEFKGRRRRLMQPNRYTELFFLDEATALAAGHRPCFECRRADARRFSELWGKARGLSRAPRAGEMDDRLHVERIGPGRTKLTHLAALTNLPDGVFRPAQASVEVLTPPSIVAVLAAGYRAMVHHSGLPAPLIPERQVW